MKSSVFHPQELTEDPDGIPCLDCGLHFRPDKLLKHRIDAHEQQSILKIFVCDLCDFKVKGKDMLVNHMAVNHMKTPTLSLIKCESCSAYFHTNIEAVGHQNQHHNNNGTRYTCHFCMKVLGSKRDLYLHRKKHYNRKRSRPKSTRPDGKRFKSYEPMGEDYD